MMPANPPSPAHIIASQVLHGKGISLYPHILPQRYQQALAGLGAGPNHLVGEQLVALADDTVEDAAFRYGAVLTDQRILARSDDVFWDVPYPELTSVSYSSGILLDDLTLFAWGQSRKLANFNSAKPVTAFLNALLQSHPHYRVPPPRPLLFPSPDDPTGAGAARMSIASGDPRILPLLGLAYEGHGKGWFPAEAGLELAARAMLLDRTLSMGRGSQQGYWLSAAGAPDLAHAFACMLGAPAAVYQEGPTRVFDFRLGGRSDAGRAAASSAVGLVSLAVLGVGWVSTPGRSVDQILVRILPGQAYSCFSVFAGQTSLSMTAPKLVAVLLENLPRIEARMLLQRAAYGWGAPPEQLDSVSFGELSARVYEAIGPVDLTCFFPRPAG